MTLRVHCSQKLSLIVLALIVVVFIVVDVVVVVVVFYNIKPGTLSITVSC